jgi:hypothetical protein
MNADPDVPAFSSAAWRRPRTAGCRIRRKTRRKIRILPDLSLNSTFSIWIILVPETSAADPIGFPALTV